MLGNVLSKKFQAYPLTVLCCIWQVLRWDMAKLGKHTFLSQTIKFVGLSPGSEYCHTLDKKALGADNDV